MAELTWTGFHPPLAELAFTGSYPSLAEVTLTGHMAEGKFTGGVLR